MKQWMSLKNLVIFVAILFAVAFPQMGFKMYYVHIGVLSLLHISCWPALICAGYAGQLSLAQAAFFGIGAYVSALLMLNLHWSFWLAAPMGALAAGLRQLESACRPCGLKGPYFVISTMGFGEIVRLVFLNWESVAPADPTDCLVSRRRIPISLGFMTLTFESRVENYYLDSGCVVGGAVPIKHLVHSRIGCALRAIRNDYIATQVMGIHTAFYRILAFGVGAALSGLTGALYAGYIRFISPDTFTIGESINILIMMVIGGMGTISGPIIGAVFITYLLETMWVFAEYRLVIYGLLMFLVILMMPHGIAGMLKKLSLRARQSRQEGGVTRAEV